MPDPLKLLPTSMRLPPPLKSALKQEADKRKWALSKLMEEILKNWLARRKGRDL